MHDDGPGVTPEDEPKLFQPFFTTKPVGKGTGLGLSVSYGIIESYGGAIGYRGNEWGGATFFFELPVTEPAARPITPRRAAHRDPMTDRLYYTDPYLRAFDATVDARRARATAASSSRSIAPRSIPPPAASRSTPGRSARSRVVDVVDEEDGTIAHVVEHDRTAGTTRRTGEAGARRDRLGAALRSHAAAHRPARAVGGVRSAVRRAHGELSPRRGRRRRSIWRARCRRPRSPRPKTEANRIVWEDRPVGDPLRDRRGGARRCRCARSRRAAGRCG